MAEIEPIPAAASTIRDGALAELEHLTRLVDRLSPRDWARPSAVEGWTIGDVVTHLDLFLGIYSRLLGVVLAGGESGSVVRTIGWLTGSVMPTAGPIFHPVNRALPKVINRLVRPEVVERRLVAGARRTRERLLRIGPDDYARLVRNQGGSYLLSFSLAIPVNELAIHCWDIESEIEEMAELSDDACRILPWFYWSGSPLMLHLPRGTTGTVQALLSEPGSAMWWSFADGALRVGRETIRNPDATIQGPPGSYVLTLAGRLKPAEVLHSSLAVEGNRGLAERFLGNWRPI